MRRTCMTMALLVAALLAGAGQGVHAQDEATAPEDSFASENAVLDTSILFAIGAREARQELRGAFGWPTFQEGLVEGVYFRFDPDGYARFAPTPRLDTDVFEVICRPRTLVCMGRKDALQVTLNNRGQVQLQLDNVSEADTFAISEGINELPLPRTILQPLDARLEILLASGGELIGRRGEQEVHRISLAGFAAVVPYLRWVAARQDYTVLPRGWPVPGAAVANDAPGLTRTSSWPSPMPQPHVVTQAAAQPMGTPGVQTDVAEVRGELNILREMLFDRQRATAPQDQSAPPQPFGAPAQPFGAPAQPFAAPAPGNRMDELLAMADMLQAEIARLQPAQPAAAPAAETPASDGTAEAEAPEMTEAQRMAQHMEYLMTELGLAPDVALMVIQQRQESPADTAMDHDLQANQDSVITDILAELRTQLPQMETAPAPAMPMPMQMRMPPQDYQLLSDYFRSVLPAP